MKKIGKSKNIERYYWCTVFLSLLFIVITIVGYQYFHPDLTLLTAITVVDVLFYIVIYMVVSDIDEAIDHILTHSTGHSEAIITEDKASAEKFCLETDSAAVYVNASTRFTDGGEFGLGCEMGISTQKMHARGPMGLSELTAYKYIIEGNGQVR